MHGMQEEEMLEIRDSKIEPFILSSKSLSPPKDIESESGSKDREDSICGLEDFFEGDAVEKIFSKVRSFALNQSERLLVTREMKRERLSRPLFSKIISWIVMTVIREVIKKTSPETKTVSVIAESPENEGENRYWKALKNY